MDFRIQKELPLERKLEILSDAAKYDVSCTSSGADRRGRKGSLGNAVAPGICHSFASDGRCISLLKILYTNECVFDCKYCINRCSNDIERTAFTPDEVCRLTVEFYKRNYIEGLFLSSGVWISPNHTMELLCQTIRKLREEFGFNGYIHVKTIPGASPELVEKLGFLADRMSVNLELPTSEGLRRLAPHKTRRTILTPMKQIQTMIYADQEKKALPGGRQLPAFARSPVALQRPEETERKLFAPRKPKIYSDFVPAGQSTQMIVGATPESDYHMVMVAQALYRNYDLKRVFYSAYISLNHDSSLPDTEKPPLLREHRLYQADWLMRFYGFRAEELLSEEKPDFNVYLDPKCDWAIRHLENFPVEVNRASYGELLRVPGIGVKSAQRIVLARRSARLDFPDLKKIGVVLKRALYFITCGGRMMYPTKIEEDYITRRMLECDRKKNWQIEHPETYRQLSLFDDRNFAGADPPGSEEQAAVLSGQF
ncbi:MAG: putative DNA modification/repair radical SAM protein [Lachnospiraceae bacterium]|nr:putative DNA modification/repair radical SAM protein [Lachnospiraceae bacterium]